MARTLTFNTKSDFRRLHSFDFPFSDHKTQYNIIIDNPHNMSDNSAWIWSYKSRNIEYRRPEIPSDEILLKFHKECFDGKFDEAAITLATYYSVKAPQITIGSLPENVPSSYDITAQIITISNSLVITIEIMATFIESFFRHLASQKNWIYDKELSEYFDYERSEGGRLSSRIFQRFKELECRKP